MTNPEERLLTSAALILCTRPYESTTLEDVAEAIQVPLARVSRFYPSMHALGTAILDHEGSSMREAQQQVAKMHIGPLERLQETFRLVGRNLAQDPIVRAGIRIAAESTHHFPERNINPFRTWERFVTSQLLEARDRGQLKATADIAGPAWLLVAAGLGTKDLLSFTGDWSSAEERLAETARLVVASVRNDVE